MLVNVKINVLLSLSHLKWQMCPEKTRWLCVFGNSPLGRRICNNSTTLWCISERSSDMQRVTGFRPACNWQSGFTKDGNISHLLCHSCTPYLFRWAEEQQCKVFYASASPCGLFLFGPQGYHQSQLGAPGSSKMFHQTLKYQKDISKVHVNNNSYHC